MFNNAACAAKHRDIETYAFQTPTLVAYACLIIRASDYQVVVVPTRVQFLQADQYGDL